MLNTPHIFLIVIHFTNSILQTFITGAQVIRIGFS